MKLLGDLPESADNNRRGVFMWMRTGSWALMDQGLFALSNFALNVLLARWLSPADYGAFAIAYTVFLLLGTFHTAILTEPMLVYGPGKYRERVGHYIGVLLRWHWWFGGIVSSLFALVGLALWQLSESVLTPTVFALAIATPFILFQWLMRRACYINMRPSLAAGAGALYMLLMAMGLFLVFFLGFLTSATGLLVMGFASLVSGWWLLRRLRGNGATLDRAAMVRESLSDHWAYGRWALGAAGLSWAAGNLLTILLPLFAGLHAVGALRAAFNLIMPVMQVFAALGAVVLPVLVRARSRGTLWRVTRLILAGYVGLAFVYGATIAYFAEPISALVYGPAYPSLSGLVVVFAVLPVSAALVSVVGGAVRALEKPRAVFFAYLVSAGLSGSVGTWLVIVHGAQGAAVGMVVASVATAVVLAMELSRSLRTSEVGQADREEVNS